VSALATVLPALLAGAMGVVLILLLGRALLRVIPFQPRDWLFRWRVRQLSQRLTPSGQLFETVLVKSDAVAELADLLGFHLTPHSPRLADLVRSHHLTVLEQLLQFAEARNAHLGEISEFLDELFETRHALHLGRMQVITTRANIRLKRTADGRGVPEWTNTEFTKKLEDIAEKLAINEKLLREQLDRALSQLRTAGTGKGMTVH